MGKTGTKNDNDQGEATFRWRTLALWAVIIALVALTALAVVATITGAETLSVVALALAVMAFVVQIIVFIVQGISSSKQAADAAELNAQTLRALATIEEKSEGTRETVGRISDRLLEFAFTKASSEAETSGATEPNQALTVHVLERAKEIIESSQGSASDVEEQTTAAPRKGASGAAVDSKTSVQSSFLDEPFSQGELTEAAQLLDQLVDNDLALSSLQRLGEDRLSAEKAGRPEQAGMSTLNGAIQMHDMGLIKRVKTKWSKDPVFVLTDKGLLAVKALLVAPAPPNETIVKARRAVEDLRAATARDREARFRKLGDIPVEG